MEKTKVYFTRKLTPDAVVEIYKALGADLKGRIAVKVHSGEAGNQNFLKPEFMKKMVDYVDGTVVECNTAYSGERNTTVKHKKLISMRGWDKLFKFDLLDAEGPDAVWEIPDGKIIRKDYVGKNLENYDSLLVLSHFKGHPMGGYGGALKQLSIGCGSTVGKTYIHTGGKTDNPKKIWTHIAKQDDFVTAMADAATCVGRHFKGNCAYINVMCNISVDCDCCAVAEDPCMKDIGIMASLDPVAVDKACLDYIRQCDDPGKDKFLKRVDSRHGELIIKASKELGLGSDEYELINID